MVTRRELALQGVSRSSVRHARSDPLEWPTGNQFGSGPGTQGTIKKHVPLFPRVILFPGHCPGKRPRGLSAHRAHGGQGAEQKAAEGTGLDDLTLFTAVSTGAGLWPGASPRTRLSSYLSTPKDRWTCLLRSHLTVCTHTHTLTHV